MFKTALMPLVIAISSIGAVALAEGEAAPTEATPAVREIEVVVDGGYKPAKITVQAGERVRLKVVKKDYSTCTKQVVFPSLDIKRELVTGKPVFIDLPALEAGEVGFQCGMNMMKGTIVVEAKK